jgi:hypothetical protein
MDLQLILFLLVVAPFYMLAVLFTAYVGFLAVTVWRAHVITRLLRAALLFLFFVNLVFVVLFFSYSEFVHQVNF